MYKLLQGDCIEEMKRIPDNAIDLILCDPPYQVTKCEWDIKIPLDEMWKEYKRIIKEDGIIILFCTLPFGCELINTSDGWFKYDLVWNKNVPTGMSYAKYRPMRYHENIFVFYNKNGTYNKILKERVGERKACYNGYDHYCGKSEHISVEKVKKKYDPNFVNPSTVLNFNVVPNRKGKLHPTQKPTDLLEWIIKTYSNENDLILDNCMGSGSTGVACLNTNRNFIGIELDERYFNIAKERIDTKNNELNNTELENENVD